MRPATRTLFALLLLAVTVPSFSQSQVGGQADELIAKCGRPTRDYFTQGESTVRHLVYQKQNVRLDYYVSADGWRMFGIYAADTGTPMDPPEANRRLACADNSIHYKSTTDTITKPKAAGSSIATDLGTLFLAIVLVSLGLGVYFVPSIVAQGTKRAGAILVLNIFLGWTVLGWIGALVWAVAEKETKAAEVAKPV